MSKYRSCIIFFLATSFVLRATASDNSFNTADDIIKLVTARQSALSTCEMEWSQSTTFPNGVAALIGEQQHAVGDAADRSKNQAPFVLRENCNVAIDGMKMFSRLDNLTAPVPGSTRVSTFDGVVTANYTVGGTGGHPSGVIGDEANSIHARLWDMKPLILTARTFDARFLGAPLHGWQLRAQSSDDTNESVVLSRTYSNGNEELLTVGTGLANAGVVHRCVVQREGRIVGQIDIKYERETQSSLQMPASWRIQLFQPRSGSITSIIEATVTSIRINRPVSADTFTIEFPVGTTVYNKKTGRDVLIRNAEPHRVISHSDSEKPYSQLVAEEREIITRIPWLYVFCGAIFVGTIAAWILSRQRRR